MKFAVYNPSDNRIRILAEPYGSISARPHELALSDSLRMATEECHYSLVINRSDEGNEYLPDSYAVEFSVATLPSPEAEALVLVNRYFSDLQVGALASLRRYVGNETSTQTLASLIAWRSSIRPLSTTLESCRLRFSYDLQQSCSFSASLWECQAKSVHTASAISGDWSGLVVGDLSDGSMKLIMQ